MPLMAWVWQSVTHWGQLKPFLTMIGSLGEGLVNAMGMGSDATKAYAETTTDAMDQTTDAVGGTEKALSIGDSSRTPFSRTLMAV